MVSQKIRLTDDNGQRGSYKTSGLGFTGGCTSVQCIAMCYGNMFYWQGEGIFLNNTENNTTN